MLALLAIALGQEPAASLQAPATPALAAQVLAAQVAISCGNPYDLVELAFTFVVEVEGVERARRRHLWRPREGTLVVVDGGQTTTLSQLYPFLASEDDSEAAIRAWSAFVNDGYWLLAACKVQDPGVQLSVDEEGRLELGFGEGVGLTPGDRYWLTVDEQGRVTRWDYRLQGGDQGGWTWEDYALYGGLLLSTRRVSAEGDAVIRFEDVRAR